MQLIPDWASAPAARWSPDEIAQWKMPDEDMHEGFKLKFSKFNPTPGGEAHRHWFSLVLLARTYHYAKPQQCKCMHWAMYPFLSCTKQ